jgi:hypothetical protein
MVRHYVWQSLRPFSLEEKLLSAVIEVIVKRMTICAATEYFDLARVIISDNNVTKVRASGNVVTN